MTTNPTPKSTTKANHYIDNAEFLKALTEYRLRVLDARSNGVEIPPVTNYIGECFLKISKHLSFKGNFINYSYRDEMVSDAIENCLACVSNFDPAKSQNPFAYFTQVCYFAFIRRIQKEQKQSQTKYKLLESLDLEGLIAYEGDGDENTGQFIDYIRKQIDSLEINKKLGNKSIDD